MFVSTCGDKFPSIRPVLLKEIKNKNFIFFTNYESKKSCELLLNNNIAACFYWEPLERCVRIEGLYNKFQDKHLKLKKMKVIITLNKDLDKVKQELGHQNKALKFNLEINYYKILKNMKNNLKDKKFLDPIFGEAGKQFLIKLNFGIINN